MGKKIPKIRFSVNGAEILVLPAHHFLVIQSFRGGNVIVPKPGALISFEVIGETETRIYNFSMPEVKDF